MWASDQDEEGQLQSKASGTKVSIFPPFSTAPYSKWSAACCPIITLAPSDGADHMMTLQRRHCGDECSEAVS